MFKKWVNNFFLVVFFIFICIGIFNYIIDPYGIYNFNINLPKIMQEDKIRLIKAIKIKDIKPASIILGTSRAETGYNPENTYFLQPSFNAGNSGASMYEERKYFEYALYQGNLKQVLLVIDYIMFDALQQRHVLDFDTYFNQSIFFKYKYLFSLKTLRDSIRTIKQNKKDYIAYLYNGQREHNYKLKYIMDHGGYSKVFYDKNYYINYLPEYKYKDTHKLSFKDFNIILNLCYKYNIKLTIIFGPSHILQWEALDRYIGYKNWLKWKKDIVLDVYDLARKYNQKPFKVVDFAIYNKWTSEKIPTNLQDNMKYYWESSHYKNCLGELVLNYLKYRKPKGLGSELNIDNIDQHLNNLKIQRKKYIKYFDIKKIK